MTEKTKIATEQIANYLKIIMREKGIIASDIITKKGIHNSKVYSVLRMGKVSRPNYSIDTFIEVIGAIGIHLELHDLAQRSNLDMDKTGQN
jgi:DNA-binding phage protein